ncbi:MAG: TonB-dependent receptor [Salinivenus sp.]
MGLVRPGVTYVLSLLLLVGGASKRTFAQDSSGTVEGRVVEAGADTPIPRANVLLQRDGQTDGTSTGPDGRFQLSVAPGTYVVEASALGYRAARETVGVAAGEAVRLDLALPPREYSLDEIVVSDHRREQQGAASTVQRVDGAAIEAQDAADVSELGPLVPATHVQTNSRGQTILYFRNAGDRQVGQFFDGALLNIPWDNRVDMSLIPAGVVGDMTVTKGVPSVQYGANVLGGAINFQSRTLDAPGHQTELEGGLGTAGQRRAAATHLGRTGRWDYTAAVQYAGRGNQPIPRDANLENNQPLSDRRVNTDRRLLSGFGRAGYRFEGGGQMGLSILHVDAEQGVAPEGNVTDGQARYWRYPLWQKTTVIASGQSTPGPNTSVRGAAWGSRFAQDIADYRSVSYDTLNQIQQGRDLTAGTRLIGSQNLPVGTLTLALHGLTSRHEKGTIHNGRPDSAPDSATHFQQHLFSAGLEYEAEIHPRVSVSVGANLDGTDYPQTGPFPERDPFYAWGLRAGAEAGLSDRWTLRGVTGRKSRFPTMRELFGAAIGKFVPNPTLNPVTAWIGELGIERRTDRWSVGSTAFLNRVYNTIGKRTFTQEIIDAENLPSSYLGKEQRINLEGARIYGVEATTRWDPSESLRLDGHLTWSRPRAFRGEITQKLDEKPAWLGTGTVRYTLPMGLSVMGQARYTGGVYARNQQNRFVPLEASLLLDARLGYDLGSRTEAVEGEVYARIDNLTDDAKFIGLGLPGPGRTLRVGIEVVL